MDIIDVIGIVCFVGVCLAIACAGIAELGKHRP